MSEEAGVDSKGRPELDGILGVGMGIFRPLPRVKEYHKIQNDTLLKSSYVRMTSTDRNHRHTPVFSESVLVSKFYGVYMVLQRMWDRWEVCLMLCK